MNGHARAIGFRLRRWTARPARYDALALGMAMAAIIMFFGARGEAMTTLMRATNGLGLGPDRLLCMALLLNIVSITFGWRRYKELCEHIQKRNLAEAHATQLAKTDALTGCLNRRGFDALGDAKLTAARMRGEALAVLVIDIDNFKTVNDSNGHAIGDAVVCQWALLQRF